jgi:hypothetical protein
MFEHPDRFCITKKEFEKLVEEKERKSDVKPRISNDYIFDRIDYFLRNRSKNIICYCVNSDPKPDNHILWDRYGEGLAGFCLEFASSAKFFYDAYSVDYLPALPSITNIYAKMCDMLIQPGLQENINLFLRELHHLAVCTKLIHYQPENEWRVTHERTEMEFANKTQVYSFENGDLVSITLGERMSQEDKEQLKSIIMRKYQNQSLQLKIAKVGANSSIIVEPFSFD